MIYSGFGCKNGQREKGRKEQCLKLQRRYVADAAGEINTQM